MTLSELINPAGIPCSCGKPHSCTIDRIVCRPGAIDEITAVVRSYTDKKIFVLCDPNTYAVAGEKVCRLLDRDGVEYVLHVFAQSHPTPDEATLGSAVMHCPPDCGMIVSVGSGVVNDTGKMLAAHSGKPYCIVATAPSMDGYASASSSMERDGLKVSLSTVCPNVILGDTDVLKNAPLPMLRSGLGDMLAKYVSICEWRLSQVINGEYYCEFVAELVRESLAKCVSNAQGLMAREEKAVEAVFEGLVVSGLAMAFAGVSRPASGCEHYFSHVWDMRSLEFGTPCESHGTQCALATLLCVRMYEELKNAVPDSQKALDFVHSFDMDRHREFLREFLGKGAEAMIAQEEKEKKYDPDRHARRIEAIIENFPLLKYIIEEELPSSADLEALMTSVGLPVSPEEIGLGGELEKVFAATKDIRDKYVLSRLVWDLGLDITPKA